MCVCVCVCVNATVGLQKVKGPKTVEPSKVKVTCFLEALTDTYLMPQCQRPESYTGGFMQQLA